MIQFNFRYRAKPENPLGTFCYTSTEVTYPMVMPAKAISTATREATPFLLTPVKWVRDMCVNVVLHVILRLGSETHHIMVTCYILVQPTRSAT
jgi:hypothetical protein